MAKRPFQHAAHVLIAAAVIGLALGINSYVGECRDIRAAEEASAYATRLHEMVETFNRLRQLGNGQLAEVRQELKFKLMAQQRALEETLASADDSIRQYVESSLAAMASDKKRHPAYYAIQK